MTAPLTLDELRGLERLVGAWNEACRTGGDWSSTFLEAQEAVWDNRETLFAAARELHDLKSALEFLNNDAGAIMRGLLTMQVDSETGDVTAAGVLAYARGLGWSPSNGGTE